VARFRVTTQEEAQPTKRFSVVEPEEKKPLNKNFVQGVISPQQKLEAGERSLKTGAQLIMEQLNNGSERLTLDSFPETGLQTIEKAVEGETLAADIGKTIVGTAKGALALAEGMIAFPLSGIAGLGHMGANWLDSLADPEEGGVKFGLEQAAQTVEKVGSLPLNQLSEEEMLGVTNVMKPLEMANESFKFWGDKTYEGMISGGFSPETAANTSALITSSLEAGLYMLALPKVGAKTKSVIRATDAKIKAAIENGNVKAAAKLASDLNETAAKGYNEAAKADMGVDKMDAKYTVEETANLVESISQPEVVGVPETFISEKTGKPFKTEAASKVRQAELAKQGIEVEVVKTSEGVVLKEKGLAEPEVTKPEPISSEEIKVRSNNSAEVKIDPKESKFFTNEALTKVQADLFSDPIRQHAINSSVEIKQAKLINDVNRYIHGEDLNISNTVKDLKKISDTAEGQRKLFDTEEAFVEFRRRSDEAASWARSQEVSRTGGPSGYGQATVEELKTLKAETEKAVKRKTSNSESSAKVDAALEFLTRKPELNIRKKVQSIVDLARAKTIDPFSKDQGKLIDNLGVEGRNIANHQNLLKGTDSRVAMEWEAWDKEIFRDLDKSASDMTNAVIHGRSVIQIDKTSMALFKAAEAKWRKGDTKKVPKLREIKHVKGANGADYAVKFEEWQNTKPATFELAQERASKYFEAMQEQLSKLYEEKLISEETFNKLKDLEYSPKELIDSIDPMVSDTSLKKGGRIQTRDSGVVSQAIGTEADFLDIRANNLLLEVIARTETRIAKHKANTQLFNLAETKPDNPFVSTKKNKGWVPIDYFKPEDVALGKKKPSKLYLEPTFGEAWATKNPDISIFAANFARISSGSFMTRPLATGLNPSFALSNLPLDVGTSWVSAGYMGANGKWISTYSPNPFTSTKQFANNFGKTFGDAMFRKGLYEDYIKYGGGMEWLSGDQGRAFTQKASKRVGSNIAKIEDFLGYFNTTSEIATRLANTQGAIEGLSKSYGIPIEEVRANPTLMREAVASAREVLDHGQGGSMVKAIDTMLPFTNSTIQAGRGTFRAWSRDPKSAAMKATTSVMLGVSMSLAAKNIAPLMWRDIRDDEKNGNFIIPLPESAGKFVDIYGQERYVYTKIRKDPAQQFFTAVGDNIIQAQTDPENFDPIKTAALLKEFSPIQEVSDVLPPSIQAIVGMTTNTDFWLDDAIWRREGVADVEQFDANTSQFLKDVGQFTGTSAEKLGYGLSRIFTNSNPYTDLMGWGYEEMFSDTPESQREMNLAEALDKVPVLTRVIGVTNPYDKYEEGVDEATTEAITNRFINTRNLDVVTEGILYHDTHTTKDLAEVIKVAVERSVSEEEGERLLDRFQFAKSIQTLPDRTLWLKMQYALPEARAQIFWDTKWRELQGDLEARKAVAEQMGKVEAANPGFFGESFMRNFALVEKEAEAITNQAISEGKKLNTNYDRELKSNEKLLSVINAPLEREKVGEFRVAE